MILNHRVRFGRVDFIGMDCQPSGNVAEGIRELSVFIRTESGFFVENGVAIDALCQP